MAHTINSIFSKVCKWCNAYKIELPSRILICPNCDFADTDTIIPNMEAK